MELGCIAKGFLCPSGVLHKNGVHRGLPWSTMSTQRRVGRRLCCFVLLVLKNTRSFGRDPDLLRVWFVKVGTLWLSARMRLGQDNRKISQLEFSHPGPHDSVAETGRGFPRCEWLLSTLLALMAQDGTSPSRQTMSIFNVRQLITSLINSQLQALLWRVQLCW
jgi:hypothetical protein